MKICDWCIELIPLHRKASAKYCSDECYYAAKKERSNKRYSLLSKAYVIKRKNEEILKQFYPLIQKKIAITYEILERCGFDWGYADGEWADSNCNIWKLIGSYCYIINKDKTVIIWKLENSKQ